MRDGKKIVEIARKIDNNAKLAGFIGFDDDVQGMNASDIGTRARFDCTHCEVGLELGTDGGSMLTNDWRVRILPVGGQRRWDDRKTVGDVIEDASTLVGLLRLGCAPSGNRGLPKG